MYDIKSINYNFGLALRTLRKKKGLSTRELAFEMDISDGTIYRAESGRIASPSIELVLRACNALDISVEEFIDYVQKGDFSWV